MQKKFMAKCNFSIPFTGNVEELIASATAAITRAGGNFQGNITSGSFEIQTFMGEIAGLYAAGNSQLDVEIIKKPMLVPCSEIENQLRKYLY